MGGRVLARPAGLSLPRWRILKRRMIVGALACAALLALYMLWFRDSTFVRVSSVKVVGAESNAKVAAALEAAAVGQSTLHLDRDALRAAVAGEPSVAGLGADPDFPHGLTITVDLRAPAGYIDRDGGVVVAGDGTVLQTGIDRPDGIPVIDAEPTASGAQINGDALVAAQVLAGVAPVMAPQVEEIGIDSEHGPVATLNGGVEVRFGDASRAEMKWRAVAAVLAEPSFTSANYLDVSVPSRPVAG